MDLAVPEDLRVKLKEDEKGTEKTMEHESDSNTNCNRYARYSHQMISKGIRIIENKNTSGDHPNDSTVKIGQNTEKKPGDLSRVVVIQTPVKDHQLMLV